MRLIAAFLATLRAAWRDGYRRGFEATTTRIREAATPDPDAFDVAASEAACLESLRRMDARTDARRRLGTDYHGPTSGMVH